MAAAIPDTFRDLDRLQHAVRRDDDALETEGQMIRDVKYLTIALLLSGCATNQPSQQSIASVQPTVSQPTHTMTAPRPSGQPASPKILPVAPTRSSTPIVTTADPTNRSCRQKGASERLCAALLEDAKGDPQLASELLDSLQSCVKYRTNPDDEPRVCMHWDAFLEQHGFTTLFPVPPGWRN
jgi:hypothetical protein